jgi:hypothetical protein
MEMPLDTHPSAFAHRRLRLYTPLTDPYSINNKGHIAGRYCLPEEGAPASR